MWFQGMDAPSVRVRFLFTWFPDASKESLLSQDFRWSSFEVIGEDMEAQ